MAEYDVFLCHCWMDKVALADPLKRALDAAGLRVWYDQVEIKLGDSFISKINEGIQKSDSGIVLFTPAFFSTGSGVRWGEVETFMAGQLASDRTSLLPLVTGLSPDEYRRRLPLLAPRRYEPIKVSPTTNRATPSELKRIARVVSEAVRAKRSVSILGRGELDAAAGDVPTRLARAKRDVFVLGNDCKAVTESYSAHLINAMRERNVSIRVLCVDPKKEEAVDHLVRIDDRFPTAGKFKESMSAVEAVLQGMRDEFGEKLFEFRYLPIAPAVGLFIIDPDLQEGFVKAEIYTPKPWMPEPTRPHFVLPQGPWRQHFLQTWENYWTMAREVPAAVSSSD
jgi:hypothetical protein